jgi:hypothetical protein
MTPIAEELQSVISKIDSEPDHDSCVRVMNKYLKKRLIQRLPVAEQAKKLYEAFQTGNIERVRPFDASQYGRIREQAANFIRMIENESHPGQVRVLHPEAVNAEA